MIMKIAAPLKAAGMSSGNLQRRSSPGFIDHLTVTQDVQTTPSIDGSLIVHDFTVPVLTGHANDQEDRIVFNLIPLTKLPSLYLNQIH
jgi:hypothetical protein